MPVEVIKYTCQFKCFKRAVNKRERMVGHEAMCWNNPDNKTCKTCKNEIAYVDEDGFNHYPVRSCKLKELADFFDTFHERLRPGPVTMQIRPIYHCGYHNADSDERIEQFVAAITKEFGTNETGTEHFPYYIPTENITQ